MSPANAPLTEGLVTPASADKRLDSWKEIAAYLKRDIRTVQRWEKLEGLPVRRHQHQKRGSAFAYRDELDAWWQNRGHDVDEAPLPNDGERAPSIDAPHESQPVAPTLSLRRRVLVGLPWTV